MAQAGGRHEVYVHVRSLHVDLLDDAPVHDAETAIGAAGVVDISQRLEPGVQYPGSNESGPRQGAARSSLCRLATRLTAIGKAGQPQQAIFPISVTTCG
jgi:hypothetical protein